MEIKCDVALSKEAREDMMFLLKTDVKSAIKAHAMIEEIARIHKNGDDPLSGTGKSEYLKGDKSGYMSRRINNKDRLVYKVSGDLVMIASFLGHYEDK